MNNLHTEKLTDLRQNIKIAHAAILQNIQTIQMNEKLMQVQAFLDSPTWKTLEKTKEGHDVAYEYFKSIFDKKVLITDNSKPTHDDTNMFSRLSPQEKAFIHKVDSAKETGFYRMGKYLVFYIGSTTTTEYYYYDGQEFTETTTTTGTTTITPTD